VIRLLTTMPPSIQQFRANAWPYQKSIVTPTKELTVFLEFLLLRLPVEGGSLATDLVVFELRHVLALLDARGIPLRNKWEFFAEAQGQEDVSALLQATLRDGPDFLFVPSPARFAIYADHDEYLTLFLPTAQALDHLIHQLEAAAFTFVPDYFRPEEGPDWHYLDLDSGG
jgi:hypothetical protein